MWTLDERLNTIVRHQIAARRQHWFEWFQRDQRPQIAEQMGAMGLSRSGAFLTAVYAAAQTALLEFGREILSEMLETLSEIYGTPPIEALAWIRSTVNGELDLLTIQLGNEVDGLA